MKMQRLPAAVAILTLGLAGAASADLVISETSPASGVVIGVNLAPKDQPIDGYLILCDGLLATDGKSCKIGDATHPDVDISDIVQWSSRVGTDGRTEWIMRMFSDLGSDPGDVEPNTLDALPTYHSHTQPQFTCPAGSVCTYRREPGSGDFGGPDPTGGETLMYTAAAGGPGYVENDAGRVYSITSDPAATVPEPDALLLLLTAAGMAGLARRSRRVG